MSNKKLKPCPFCGGEASLLRRHKRLDGGGWYKIAVVECDDCGSNSGDYIVDGHFGVNTSEQDAIDAWNRRVEKE